MATLANGDSLPSALQQAGVTQRRFAADGLVVEERIDFSAWRLHSRRSVATLQRELGSSLPTRVNESVGEGPAVLCVAPDRWLLVGAGDYRPPDPGHTDTALLDVTDGLVALRIAGVAAPWLLAKLSGLDFLAGRGGGRHCAQTRLGRIAVLIHYHDPSGDEFVFDLMAERSVARYLWELLSDAAPHAGELAGQFGSVR